MSFLTISNIRLSGISACVPKTKLENANYSLFGEGEANDFIQSTGIERRRQTNDSTCASDLCINAAQKLIGEMRWDKDEIAAVVFVTQSPDYILPATSPLIQDKLGLNEDCLTLDISLGCSGWVYGMSVLCSLLSQMKEGKKGLLLAGDTILKFCSESDKSTFPLFGDAGTATAFEYDKTASDICFNLNSDGKGYSSIIIKDGGYRNPSTVESFSYYERGKGISSNNLQLQLDGMNVFSFGISKVPKSINRLIDNFSLNKDSIDYYIFHQANLFMNEKIRKKLNLEKEKVPYSLKEFGNTSCATIPLTMVYSLSNELKNKELKHIACGFGVGLSWGSVYFETNKIICPEILEY